ncbi:unnamed protein product [Chilo suppressalis]|uniref:Major facilitator superfamily (MFS) profile domain-containing protein n=1 Tax=Chilo suppressalis TaxID=168631 RepID=A0ABN8EDT7_CHISP|nr:unnamed protein product [Chilo suppressalis]
MTSVEGVVLKNKKYELVPPDGGWGYMIVLASVIIFIATISFLPFFGLLYNDFLKEIGVSSTEVTVVNGVCALCLSIGGFLTSPLLKVMNFRTLAIVGAIVFNIGSFLLLFCKSILPFIICMGIFQATGMGLLYNLSFTILNDYFVQRRLFAFCTSQTLTAIFGMFAPQLILSSLDEYGYRGTLLLVLAIGLQTFVGVALFQPVAWHMKKVKLPTVEEVEARLLKENIDSNTPMVKLKDLAETDEEQSTIKSDIDNNDAKKSGFMKVLKDLFDVPTLKLVVTSVTSWAVGITMFADFTFTMMMPQALYAAQWYDKNVATAMSIVGFGDLAARIAFVCLSNILHKIGNAELYIIGLFISSVAKLGMMFSKNITIVYVFVAGVGVGRCFLSMLLPMVFGDLCPEKFSAVMGIGLVFMGLIALAFGPLVGLIRDFTDSYVITFHILIGVNIVCMIVWSAQLVHCAMRRRRASKK